MRRIRALLFSLLLALGITVAVSQPAFASTTLCSNASYSTCINAGFTAHGYENSTYNSTSYWSMIAGHNCTNYVAFVGTQNGVSIGYNLGSALNWASNASAHGVTVNSTPAAGAVAQWNAGTLHPTNGHVAYVESVNGDGSITISQDNYSTGPFGWETIPTGDANWPNNFIHFKDLAKTVGLVNSGGASYSTNSGNNWSQLVSSANSPTAISVSANVVGVINSSGAYYSTNAGVSWTQIVSSTDHPTSISVNGKTIGVVTSNGAFYSSNAGTSWTQLNSAANAPTAIAVNVNTVGLINSGGAFYSTTYGASWTQLASSTDHPSAISVNGAVVGMVTSSGAYRSINGGANWTQLASSTDSPSAITMNGNTVGMITSSGAYYSVDAGANWTQLASSGTTPTAIAVG